MASGGGAIALAGALTALGLALAAIAQIVSAIIAQTAAKSFTTFLLGLAALGLLGVAALFGYWALAFFRLRYRLDRNAITILWGDRQQRIPMRAVTKIESVASVLDRVRSAIAEGRSYLPDAQPSPPDDGAQSAYERFQAAFEDAPFEMPQSGRSAISNNIKLKALLDAPVAVAEPIATNGRLKEIAPAALPAPATSAEADFADFPEALSYRPQPWADIAAFDPDPELSHAHDTLAELPDADPDGTHADVTTTASTGQRVSFTASVRGINWPGYHVGRGHFAPVGEVVFYTTTPFANALLVHTARRAYAISPAEPQAFVREYNLRRRLGQLEPVAEGARDGWFTGHPLWRDRMAWWLLGLGATAAAFLFAFLFLRYSDLPETLRIHFNQQGQADRLGGREDLFWLPVIGMLVFLANAALGFVLQRRDRVIARLLYGVSLVTLGLLWLAVLGIIATATRAVPGIG